MTPDLHDFWRLVYLLAGEPHYLVVVEVIAAICGLLGSLLLALKGQSAPWGWMFFMLSNVGWLAFSYGFGHWFLLVQQIGFSITSAIGIWKWLIEPRLDPRVDKLLNEVLR